MKKTILLATFSDEENLQETILNIQKNFNVNKNDLFYFNVIQLNKIIITYKIIQDEDVFIDINNKIKKTLIIHKKGGTLYTINALNKLIEFENPDKLGNIKHKDIIVDWSKFQNKLILIDNKNLNLFDIKRIFI
jgi:hypothetical protein